MEPITTAAILVGVGAASGLAGGIFGYKGAQASGAMYDQAASYRRAQKGLMGAQRLAEYQAATRQAELYKSQAGSLEGEMAIAEQAGLLNEALGQIDAVSTKKAGVAQATELLRQGEKFIGSQVVGFYAAGVELEGTPALFMEESAQMIEDDADAIMEAASLQELSLETGAALSRLSGQQQALALGGQQVAALYNYASATRSAANSLAMIPHDSFAIDMDAWSLNMQGTSARYAGWGSLLNGVGRAAQMGASYFA